MPGYDPTTIEKKWQAFWAAHKTFAAPALPAPHTPKFYALDMFPYPSGAGLHVGHPEGYTATDIISRYKRARGFAVMHPMGWDAFGLPAERYAIQTNTHPRVSTQKNNARFRQQLQAIGFSYDWDREVDTTDPNYYRWTQWIFLLLFDTWFDGQQQKGRPIADLIAEFRTGKREIPGAPDGNPGQPRTWDALSATHQRTLLAHYRLAYQAEVPVNWCPGLGTVLANEEVIDGKSEVGGFPVERRTMKQWMLRITAYAQRLLDGLPTLQWTDSLKEMQRNWIGRSEGAEVHFEISNPEISNPTSPAAAPGPIENRKSRIENPSLTVFTTRPDTLFGATYMVLAPEHPLVAALTTPAQKAKVEAYQKWVAGRSELQRQQDTRKTGEFTGAYALNPVNQQRIPIYIADYVLMGYGTGAIMAVPAHDERDHEFARAFHLPILQVVAPCKAADGIGGQGGGTVDVQKAAFAEEGLAINSPWIEGLPTPQAKAKITQMLEQKGLGKKQITYRIRDWIFSRQHYWGEPFPLVHLQDGTTVPLADSELPLRLPELEDFQPTGTIDPPLSKAPQWFNVHVLLENAPSGPGVTPPGYNPSSPGTESLGSPVARTVPPNTPHALPARRELNTMPQWAGSCWYYLRYLDAHNPARFVDPEIERYWLGPTESSSLSPQSSSGPWPLTPGPSGGGVDLYVGGVEHAVLHLLYSRFWHKVLFDRGLVSSDEPFRRLVNQGLILGELEYTAFQDAAGHWLSADRVDLATAALLDDHGRPTAQQAVRIKLSETDVEKKGDTFVLKANPAIKVDARSYKMSKSRGNVVNPDDVIAHYGADSLRMFEMFMGPLEQVKPWSTAGVEGVYRFLQRVWRNLLDTETDAVKTVHEKAGQWLRADGTPLPADQQPLAAKDAAAILRPTHRLIKKVTDDIERMSLNTPIAALMEFNNLLAKLTYIPTATALTLLRLMEPFAPHFAEELHARLTHTGAPHGNAVLDPRPSNASPSPSSAQPEKPVPSSSSVPSVKSVDSIPKHSISALPWPTFDPALTLDTTLDLPVQVNGKLRGRIQVPADAPEETIFAAALADPEIQKHLGGKPLKKKIYAKARMVNLVV